MADKKELYADGIEQIHFAGGMIRMDMMTFQPGEEGQPPKPETQFRIVMPPQGFLAAFNSMNQILEKLAQAGIIKKNN